MRRISFRVQSWRMGISKGSSWDFKDIKITDRPAIKLGHAGEAACYHSEPMDDLIRKPATDPTEIFVQRDGLYAPELFAVALVGVDFFSWLAKSPADART